MEELEEEKILTYGADFVPTCNLNCRFYEKQFPESDDLVMIKIMKVEEVGAYVNLLEYNNIEGMILSSEYTRKRTRSVSRLIKVGKEECVMVLRVDTDKGYIDLSRRKAKIEEAKICEKKFK